MSETENVQMRAEETSVNETNVENQTPENENTNLSEVSENGEVGASIGLQTENELVNSSEEVATEADKNEAESETSKNEADAGNTVTSETVEEKPATAEENTETAETAAETLEEVAAKNETEEKSESAESPETVENAENEVTEETAESTATTETEELTENIEENVSEATTETEAEVEPAAEIETETEAENEVVAVADTTRNLSVVSEGEEQIYLTQGFKPTLQIAEHLRAIAGQIENGKLVLGIHEIPIPEYVVMKAELEEEHNGDIAPINFEIEVEITFPVRLQED